MKRPQPINSNSFRLTVFGLLSLCCGSQLFGQERLNLATGVGFPEAFNVGVRYQLEQSQIGIGVGYQPFLEGNTFSVSGDFFYHLDGSSQLSERRPWYARTGLSYIREETTSRIDKSLVIGSRMGREMNLTRKFGVQADVGALYIIYHDRKRKEPSDGWDISLLLPVWPSLGVGLFYRL